MPLENYLNNSPVSAVIENIGLTSIFASQRLKIDGYNELPSQNKRSFLRVLFETMGQPMFALLIGGGIVYLLLGDRVEALFLLVFACLSITITIVQESRSEKVLLPIYYYLLVLQIRQVFQLRQVVPIYARLLIPL